MNIKSNEVRKGNWVNDVGSQPFQIDAVDIVALSQSEIAGKINPHYNPIPLTEQVLVDCGFRKENGAEWSIEYENDYFIVAKQGLELSIYLGYDVDIYFEIELTHIQSLHQLQNLYFALTGTELTYTQTNK